jgi:hypothetical protein
MRDTRLPREYFDQVLARLARETASMEKLMAEIGPVASNNRQPFYFLYLSLTETAHALYSRGDDPAAMVPCVRRMADLLVNFDKQSQYMRILETLTLAVLLDLDDDVFQTLADTYDRLRLRDYLSDFLLQSRVPGIDYTKTDFFSKKMGTLVKLRGVIEADPAEQPVLMKAYLSRWYSSSSGEPFYGSHNKPERLLYHGYWSMEAGAVAKVLGFDDRILRDRNYYPYDLVHYRPVQ